MKYFLSFSSPKSENYADLCQFSRGILQKFPFRGWNQSCLDIKQNYIWEHFVIKTNKLQTVNVLNRVIALYIQQSHQNDKM